MPRTPAAITSTASLRAAVRPSAINACLDRPTPFALALAALCALLAGCERDVSYEVRHQLRDVRLQRADGELHAVYHLFERREWFKWPCISHGCGDSEVVDEQTYRVSWRLPPGRQLAASRAVTRVADFTDIGELPSRTSAAWDPFAARAHAAPGRRQFTREDRLGNSPVLENGGSGCRRTLPCFVVTADRAHALVIDRIHVNDSGEVVHDLAQEPEYARFIDAAIEHFSPSGRKGPASTAPMRYALSNDLRYVVAYPSANGCSRAQVVRKLNTVVVYDRRSRGFALHYNRELAEAGLQPTRHVQHAYFDGEDVRFLSIYGRWTRGAPPLTLGCGDETFIYDFDVTTGRNRALDAAAYTGHQFSVEGTSLFHTRLDLQQGLVELAVFDIANNEQSAYALAIP